MNPTSIVTALALNYDIYRHTSVTVKFKFTYQPRCEVLTQMPILRSLLSRIHCYLRFSFLSLK